MTLRAKVASGPLPAMDAQGTGSYECSIAQHGQSNTITLHLPASLQIPPDHPASRSKKITRRTTDNQARFYGSELGRKALNGGSANDSIVQER